jgi:hypothetical protein
VAAATLKATLDRFPPLDNKDMDSFNMETAACLLRAVATYMSGMYFGGTFYCSIVECKAR